MRHVGAPLILMAPKPTDRPCAECQRLWAEYVSAVLEHIRVERQLYFASLADASQAQSLNALLERAVVAEKSIRELIRDHESSHRAGEAA